MLNADSDDVEGSSNEDADNDANSLDDDDGISGELTDNRGEERDDDVM